MCRSEGFILNDEHKSKMQVPQYALLSQSSQNRILNGSSLFFSCYSKLQWFAYILFILSPGNGVSQYCVYFWLLSSIHRTWVSWKRYIIFELFQLGGYCTLRALSTSFSSSRLHFVCKSRKIFARKKQCREMTNSGTGSVVLETIVPEILLHVNKNNQPERRYET